VKASATHSPAHISERRALQQHPTMALTRLYECRSESDALLAANTLLNCIFTILGVLLLFPALIFFVGIFAGMVMSPFWQLSLWWLLGAIGSLLLVSLFINAPKRCGTESELVASGAPLSMDWRRAAFGAPSHQSTSVNRALMLTATLLWLLIAISGVCMILSLLLDARESIIRVCIGAFVIAVVCGVILKIVCWCTRSNYAMFQRRRMQLVSQLGLSEAAAIELMSQYHEEAQADPQRAGLIQQELIDDYTGASSGQSAGGPGTDAWSPEDGTATVV
jgi:FtsH-binding integral membrane protein